MVTTTVEPCGPNQPEMMRRLRLGNLRKLLRDRCGPTLPDDDAGREYLRELLLPVSVGPNADIKMPNTTEVWAPWMPLDEVLALIAEIGSTPISRRKINGRLLGKRLRVTNGERERLKLWTIAPYDMNPQQVTEQRRAKDRARKRLRRELDGCNSRSKYEAASTNHVAPWQAAGISRATWYRQRETGPSAEQHETETGPSEVILVRTADTPVSPEQASPPEAAVQRTPPVPKPRTPRKLKKPERPKVYSSNDETNRELGGRTCLKSAEPARDDPEPDPKHDREKWLHWRLRKVRLESQTNSAKPTAH
jgi:hypothetical protein